jgi:hypothetical protein
VINAGLSAGCRRIGGGDHSGQNGRSIFGSVPFSCDLLHSQASQPSTSVLFSDLVLRSVDEIVHGFVNFAHAMLRLILVDAPASRQCQRGMMCV